MSLLTSSVRQAFLNSCSGPTVSQGVEARAVRQLGLPTFLVLTTAASAAARTCGVHPAPVSFRLVMPSFALRGFAGSRLTIIPGEKRCVREFRLGEPLEQRQSGGG